MKFTFKIWHFLILIWIVLLLLRYELLLNIYELIFAWSLFFINDSETALNQINFNLIDYFASGLLFILLSLTFFFLRRKFRFLYLQITPASFFLVLLIICFLFAPFVTDRNPDFYKNIGMTKLLPPFSKVEVIHFINNVEKKENSFLENFILMRDKVVKKSFDEKIEYVDSIKNLEGKIIYYQNGLSKETEKQNLVFGNGNVHITSKMFLLGSDQFGRDVFTRLIYGARISLLIGSTSVIISLLIGITFGFFAGYIGGIFDIIFSRITDMFLSFPMIFFVVLILALFGNSLIAVIAVLGFSGWMSLFKVVKTEVLSIKNKNYFISSRLLGLSKRQLLIKEVLPVIIVPVVISVIFQFGNVIIAESALSYLGLGVGENYPSWGSMIQSGQEYLSYAWWMIFFPGITLIFTLLSANSFGNLLNRKLNPQLQND